MTASDENGGEQAGTDLHGGGRAAEEVQERRVLCQSEAAIHRAGRRAASRPERVWYVSYGSNMNASRFGCYLAGGTPEGGSRAYPGCRDPRVAAATRGHSLPGGIYFATESQVWGGGRAFYDPALPGTAPARAYLITSGQFADIVAQEMYREPGDDLDLAVVLATGRTRLGPGRYETLLHTGDLDGYPVLTFTAPWTAADVAPLAPSTAYLAMLASGLCDAHGWTLARAADYLAGRPGAQPTWTPHTLLAALQDPPAQ